MGTSVAPQHLSLLFLVAPGEAGLVLGPCIARLQCCSHPWVDPSLPALSKEHQPLPSPSVMPVPTALAMVEALTSLPACGEENLLLTQKFPPVPKGRFSVQEGIWNFPAGWFPFFWGKPIKSWYTEQ